MRIGEGPAAHDIQAKRHLPVGKNVGCCFAPTMQILAKVERIASFIRFAVIIDYNDTDIFAFPLIRLDYKRKRIRGHAYLIVKILNVSKNMHANTGIFAVMLEDDLLMSMFPVERRNLEQGLGVVYSRGVRRQKVAEDSGLKDFGPARQL